MGSQIVMLFTQQQALANLNTASNQLSNLKILQIFKQLIQTEFLSQVL